MTETIAYIDRQTALDAGIREGWTNAADVDRDALLDLQWGERDVLDDPSSPDPECLQLVSYVVIMRGDEVFLTQRLEGGGESRLHGKVSAGVGGHISFEDRGAHPERTTLFAASRELREEVDFDAPTEMGVPLLRRSGYIYDPSTEVGSVHLGCVYTLQVDSCEVRETDVLRGFWAKVTSEVGVIPKPFRLDEDGVVHLYGHVLNVRCPELFGGSGKVEFESWADIVLQNINAVRGAA